MKYEKIIEAKFLSRPNRFVAMAELDGKEVSVHVKNTGRCRELLVPNAAVYLEDFTYRLGKRKLMYDLVAVKKGDLLINMDSQSPNKVVKEAMENKKIKLPEMSELAMIRPETFYKDSRFDFYLKDINGEEGFAEVKGVTLENNGIASFPDAPTERGIKHLHELAEAVRNGYHSYVLFVIQMSGMKMFKPNDECHKAFGEALRFAVSNGVRALAYECAVTEDTLEITLPVRIKL